MMAQLWMFSNFFREKCQENDDTQKLCKTIAAKYMESEKQDLRSQNARQENITLKIDVANLESVCQILIENEEAQAELDTLLKDYYEEHLKATFDIDECEIEKLFGYEEIKIELESRDSFSIFQQFYNRKVKMATMMEQRQIVRKYRQMEHEFLKTEAECKSLEERLNKLKTKANEKKLKIIELHKCILGLVKGSKELDDIYSHQESDKRGFKLKNIKMNKNVQKPIYKRGLSSRLLLDFNNFEMPSVAVLPKVRAINPTKGFSRLLEQAEVLRKSMQSNTFHSPENILMPAKLTGILKIQPDLGKSPEISHKTVSFKTDTEKDSASGSKTTDETSIVTIDSTVIESTNESESKITYLQHGEVQCAAEKLEILENIIIKPAGTPVQSMSNNKVQSNHILKTKRKITEDHNYVAASPPKKKRNENLDASIDIEAKSFMDMFLDFSKDTPMTANSDHETQTKVTKADDEKCEVKKKAEDTKKKIQNEKQENNKKAKKSKESFDDFEDFFTGFAASGSDKDNSEEDMSFDFFGAMENTNEECPDENASFSF